MTSEDPKSLQPDSMSPATYPAVVVNSALLLLDMCIQELRENPGKAAVIFKRLQSVVHAHRRLLASFQGAHFDYDDDDNDKDETWGMAMPRRMGMGGNTAQMPGDLTSQLLEQAVAAFSVKLRHDERLTKMKLQAQAMASARQAREAGDTGLAAMFNDQAADLDRQVKESKLQPMPAATEAAEELNREPVGTERSDG